jgi:hypothetical protein
MLGHHLMQYMIFLINKNGTGSKLEQLIAGKCRPVSACCCCYQAGQSLPAQIPNIRHALITLLTYA